MSYQNQSHGHSPAFDAVHFQITPPALPYSNNTTANNTAPACPAAVTSRQVTASTQPRTTPLRRERASRGRANSQSHHQIQHPELLRILMTSQTAVMPTSPTNPAYARVRPTAPVEKGPSPPRLNAQQLQLQQQMDKEKQLLVRGIGITVGVVMLLTVAVRCFADAPLNEGKERKAATLAALPPKAEEEKAPADSKDEKPTPADIKAPDKVEMEMTINNDPPVYMVGKYWPPLPSLMPPSDTITTIRAREASLYTVPSLRQPSTLRFLELPSGLRRAMPIVHPKALPVVKVKVAAAPSVPSAPRETALPPVEKVWPVLPAALSKELDELFTNLRASFWKSEDALAKRAFDTNIEMERPQRSAMFLPGLSPTDAIADGYYRSAEAADAFIRLLAKNKINEDPRLAPVLYLGGLSHYTLGHYGKALEYLQRLREQYPDYKREQYLVDRIEPDHNNAVPVAASLAKLVLFLNFKSLPEKPADAFASLKQVTDMALSALSSQQSYARWVSAKSDEYNIKTFDEGLFGSEPDQRRASALPSTTSLVSDAWDKLVEQAAQKAGGLGMRTFLRGQAKPGEPLAKLAAYHLDRVDALILKSYFAEAQRLLDAHDFDGARSKYKLIMAEYEGTEVAEKAKNILPGIVPVAVTYYKNEGEKNYRDADPGQYGKPQTKAREFFEKMYKEDPDGPQSDYALYWWSRSLGTEGNSAQAVIKLQQLEDKYPNSALRPEVMYTKGFISAGGVGNYDDAAKAWKELIENYPNHEKTPEALWHLAFILDALGRPKEALPYMQKLHDGYHTSPRWKYSKDFIDSIQYFINTGKRSWNK